LCEYWVGKHFLAFHRIWFYFIFFLFLGRLPAHNVYYPDVHRTLGRLLGPLPYSVSSANMEIFLSSDPWLYALTGGYTALYLGRLEPTGCVFLHVVGHTPCSLLFAGAFTFPTAARPDRRHVTTSRGHEARGEARDGIETAHYHGYVVDWFQLAV
jgi:hypothetical protein